MIYNPNEKQN